MEAPQDFWQKVLRWLQSILERSADRSAENSIWISWDWVHWLEFIDPRMATGKLPCADFISQVKAQWFAQNQKWQPLVAKVTRLQSLCKRDSLKVGLTNDWSTIVPLTHTGAQCNAASTYYKRWKQGKLREWSLSFD